MSQTSAPLREMVPGCPGLMAEPFQSCVSVTKVNPNDKSYYGRMVVSDGAGEDSVKHPDAAAQQKAGVVASTHAITSKDDGDDAHYSAKECANVLNQGRIWVKINQDVAYGDDVYFVNDGGADAGKFRMDATGAEQLLNAEWVQGGLAADGIALLQLDVL